MWCDVYGVLVCLFKFPFLLPSSRHTPSATTSRLTPTYTYLAGAGSRGGINKEDGRGLGYRRGRTGSGGERERGGQSPGHSHTTTHRPNSLFPPIRLTTRNTQRDGITRSSWPGPPPTSRLLDAPTDVSRNDAV
ncbi:hypothetical protein E2C01_030750 [Portunus trituberculatus]|uniref:Secreted protein n=1 Tax=Portunus trituberculatus TaxID=210409 RepID=A0A5B7EVR0_PORTR|nr:hypothetical protein [Portunus trituberculatus]